MSVVSSATPEMRYAFLDGTSRHNIQRGECIRISVPHFFFPATKHTRQSDRSVPGFPYNEQFWNPSVRNPNEKPSSAAAL